MIGLHEPLQGIYSMFSNDSPMPIEKMYFKPDLGKVWSLEGQELYVNLKRKGRTSWSHIGSHNTKELLRMNQQMETDSLPT
ncbi:hypothetical protein VNO77_19301 [Canavalia gladiata]|uniref:Uncharacterized protein n=1 Tax=Canavalia gladiata TaxID=3824 RepID=A0AAN9QL92_CANGL